MAKITFDNFEDSINDILIEYGQKCIDALNDSTAKVANEAVKKLKKTSPKGPNGYAKSWKVKKLSNSRFGNSVIIHNAKHYQLTHLLEFGHAKSNGEGKVDPIPHIAPINDEVGDAVIVEFNKRLNT